MTPEDIVSETLVVEPELTLVPDVPVEGQPEPEPEPEAPRAPKPRPYIPTTGRQISTFVAAAENGMPNLYEATETEVDAFVNGLK